MRSRVLRLRRSDVCRSCGCVITAGTRAHWDAHGREVTCLRCRAGASRADPASAPVGQVAAADPAPAAGSALSADAAPQAPRAAIDRGRAGASAEREYLRRRRNREARTRRRHPRIGGLLLALRAAPRHETSFAHGGRGERAVARTLERRTARGPAVLLHDRRMPGGYGNIDHLAIAPRGVFVIDAKAIRGKVRVARPLLGRPRLLVRGRSRPKLIDGLDRQVAAVRRALDGSGHRDVPVLGVLCFTEAELPPLGRAIAGHRLHYCRGVARKLNRRGPISPDAIETLTRILRSAFPPA
jgi:Nuclease-related domain